MNRRSKMKKLIATLVLATASTGALAHNGWGHGGYNNGGYHGGYGHGGYYNNSYNYVMPLLIGGVIGYQLGQPRYGTPVTTIYQQPQVIYQQPQSVYQNCTAWVETIDQYGNIIKTRTCY